MPDWREASAQCDAIVETIDEDIPDWKKEKDEDGFLEDVRGNVVDMQVKIDDKEFCTDNMKRVLNSWQEAVRKWVPD